MKTTNPIGEWLLVGMLCVLLFAFYLVAPNLAEVIVGGLIIGFVLLDIFKWFK
jgi:hypothetical protein